MAVEWNKQFEAIRFTAQGDSIPDTVNIESISFQGGPGTSEIRDKFGKFLSQGTTTSANDDLTHYFYGKTAYGITATIMPTNSEVIIQLRQGGGR